MKGKTKTSTQDLFLTMLLTRSAQPALRSQFISLLSYVRFSHRK